MTKYKIMRDGKWLTVDSKHVLWYVQDILANDVLRLGYTAEGHCKGDINKGLAPPTRLHWDIPSGVWW